MGGLGRGVMPPTQPYTMMQYVLVFMCSLVVGFIAGYIHTWVKKEGSVKNEQTNRYWWIEDPSPCGVEAGTPDTICCEGCGRHTPLHIWEMLGMNCYYGTCVGGLFPLDEWMSMYDIRVEQYKAGNLNAFDDIDLSKNINHQEYQL